MKTKMTPIEELRHSSAHVLASAVLRLFPEAKLDIGPPTATGFYYDFDLEHRFTPEDLERIEEEMRSIIAEKQPFERRELSREEAATFFRERQQSYKLERLSDIPEGEAISFYQNGEFIDLCRGTHLSDTGQIPKKAIKLLTVSGAYFRGDERQKQLQRIYGTAFFSDKELRTYLNQLEQAKLRDHRKLGKSMELFHTDSELVGPGLILWTPKGTLIRQVLQDFIRKELDKQGYDQVITPHIGRLALYRTSGHYPYYADSQYPAMIEPELLHRLSKEGCSCADLSHKLEQGEIEGYLLKPMNCPMHIRLYQSRPRSYRELPVRFAEFGTVYRWEQSGEIGGLTRVRGFTQDDAHLFCTQDQLQREIEACLSLVKKVLSALSMDHYEVQLSLRDPQSDRYAGDPALWDKAEAALKEAVRSLDIPYNEVQGEAAFYGPKIDFMVADAIGRKWQLGTVQVDYVLPERFDLTYTAGDNQMHRPVMIHRAPFGSMERFIGMLIEHFGGNFPCWIAPEQVRILTINDALIGYAEEVCNQLKQAGIRAHIDRQSDKLGAKIRRSEKDKIPYTLVIGEKEAHERSVSVRSRVNKDAEGSYSIDAFLTHIQAECQTH